MTREFAEKLMKRPNILTRTISAPAKTKSGWIHGHLAGINGDMVTIQSIGRKDKIVTLDSIIYR